ncbi:hypothetical protein BN168_420010 [Clostridioides difficile CD002]|nr:hypothetical protein BN168_420010 [Clostridioides difficile CD002]
MYQIIIMMKKLTRKLIILVAGKKNILKTLKMNVIVNMNIMTT